MSSVPERQGGRQATSRRSSTLVILLALALTTGVMGCGKSAAKVGAGDVATVGDQHITQEAFDQAMKEQKASLIASGQKYPDAGSTEFAALKTNAINVLVQRTMLDGEATKLGLTVAEKEVDAEITKVKKDYFGGKDKEYTAALAKQGFTDAQYRDAVRQQLLEKKLYDEVTKEAKASAKEISEYYAQNLSRYQQAPTRKVKEILVGKNKESLAKDIVSQLKSGADFAVLAKKYSQDPGSKDIGGDFTATQGQEVPEFDKAVFDPKSKTDVVLDPVNTAQYGWFVIKPVGEIVPGKTTSQKEAAAAIRTELDKTKQDDAARAWLEDVQKSYCSGGKIRYQTGYVPSPDPCDALASANVTTT